MSGLQEYSIHPYIKEKNQAGCDSTSESPNLCNQTCDSQGQSFDPSPAILHNLCCHGPVQPNAVPINGSPESVDCCTAPFQNCNHVSKFWSLEWKDMGTYIYQSSSRRSCNMTFRFDIGIWGTCSQVKCEST